MITIIYSTHKDETYNKKFEDHILKSVGLENVQVIEFVNHNTHSLAEVYNQGIKMAIYDIIVCCHNDIHLEKEWGKKLLKDFSNNPEFGIIGKAGSCYFPKSGVYWEKMQQTMVGQVYHQPEPKNKWLSKYSPKLPFLIPVVTIDGLFIAFNKTKIKHNFDETIGRFHFYDHGFCIPNYLDGVKIGVTSSFEITHQSVGRPNQEFFETKEKFLEKWGDKLPLDLKPEILHVPVIQEKTFKKFGKVAVVIPTKGKTDLLYNCVKSFYDKCDSHLFDIFIADTGSTNEEKNWIKENILPLGKINLIEYDYYNFAKINNDVVKNHLTNEHEFILFCNNDIVLLNNVISGMLKVFKNQSKVGTVGARLHYKDKTIQHNGIKPHINSMKVFILSHLNENNYFNYTTNINEVFGNTAALMMIKKDLFINCGLFNEKYSQHFEDVELNAKCIIKGYHNYCDGSLVAYHYESQTRKEDLDRKQKEMEDYEYRLIPFMVENLKPLKNFIQVNK